MQKKSKDFSSYFIECIKNTYFDIHWFHEDLWDKIISKYKILLSPIKINDPVYIKFLNLYLAIYFYENTKFDFSINRKIDLLVRIRNIIKIIKKFK